FWSTAWIETTNEGTKILATVDGKPRTISKSSIRRNLKLNDEEGISSLPDVELFENLALMGYNILPNQNFTFQKGQFSHQWKFLIHTIMKCLSPKSTGFNEFSSNIATAVDRENIIKTSALPHDSTPRVTSLDADEGSMQQQLQELTGLCTRLQRQQTEMAYKINAQDLEIYSLKARIKLLEDKDRGSTELSRDDAPIKGRKLVNVLTSMDATNILTSGVQAVSVPLVVEVSTISVLTVSGLVPTISAIFTTASVVTPYSRRSREISTKDKGKDKVVESDTPKKKKLQEQIDVQVARGIKEEMAIEDQRMNEQIARDAEIARIHAEEELKMMIDGLDRSNEMIVKHLQEYEQSAADLTIGEKIELINELVKYQDHHAKILKYQTQQSKPLSKKEQREFYMLILRSHARWKTKHFRGMTLEEMREKFIPVWKQFEDFMLVASKEEGERVKRKGLKLEHGSTKKIKTSEEVSEEDLKEMIEDLNQLWALVKETLSIRQASSDKEKELWVELKRLFKPEFEDQLWTHTQALMHDPLEWKLYDTCGVHHTDGQSERNFWTLENMFRACVRNLVVVGILTFREAGIGESKMIGLELEQETTKGKLAPRYVGPSEILKRISLVAYRLRLPEELSDKTLRFVEEPVEIMDREVKRLKYSRISLGKVHWNSKRGPEFTWEQEDYMKSKYAQLFVERA
nr:hypothetical protein [Tanacetum cinerariifolium]